jgi:hypothetical protein
MAVGGDEEDLPQIGTASRPASPVVVLPGNSPGMP